MTLRYFIGVDVGTASARAGIFDARGNLIATAKREIALFLEGADIAEQSSSDVWRAVCESVREALVAAQLQPSAISGIGFDATCSLVALGPGGDPIAVGAHGDNSKNIIVWMDHRATDQARRINLMRHRVLDYVGGKISPEMETPKLLWLKENLPNTYASAWQFLDLVDFLTWRATGSLARSVCTVTCKWTYLAHEQGWDESYFRQIGLGDLADQGFARIGTSIVAAGEPLAAGLTTNSAAELGLLPGTPVGAGLIDAHAGGLGSIVGRQFEGTVTSRMAYVFGTSACTLASSTRPTFIPGVWGPYYSAMIPGLWLNEGGQSSAGAAIDQLISLHPFANEARAKATAKGQSLPDFLAHIAESSSPSLPEAVHLARNYIVVPEFLGNRSPHADPDARGIIAGFGMERDLDGLVSLYVAGILGIGYGLRQIIEVSRAKGATVDLIALSGGAGRHPLIRQLLADCSGVPLAASRQPEPVLLGGAMLAATASRTFQKLDEAMAAMSQAGDLFQPAAGEIAHIHARRFAAFETLQASARACRLILNPEN